MKRVTIGLIGFGTVGSGVAEVLKKRRMLLREKAGVDLYLKKVCDKDITSKRPVNIRKEMLTKSVAEVLYDPEISIVVELIGGIMPAKDIILEAIRQGKHVVTANKALLAEAGPEIFRLAKTCGALVEFEASVGGGIPIIRSLREGFVANNIELMYGIINGTSNFILSQMAKDGVSFREALKDAQKHGYAEKNPSLDISGLDAAHKLAVLAFLGFGFPAKVSDIYAEGIERIDENDIRYAAELGYAVKPLAIAKRIKDEIELRVHPTLIRETHPISSVNGVYNAMYVKGDLVGESLFYGEGAGRYPTASSVVSDIAAIAQKIAGGGSPVGSISVRRPIIKMKRMGNVVSRHYIRFSAVDKPGVLARIAGILGRLRISIANVTQKQNWRSHVVPIVMMTHKALESDVTQALREIDGLSVIKTKSVRIRIED